MADTELANQFIRIESMTNVELRAELKQRGCPISGNKKDLLAKLRTALQKEHEDVSTGYAQNETSITRRDSSNDHQIVTHQPLAVNSPTPSTVYPLVNIPRVDITPVKSSTPEKSTRTRSKKLSVESRSEEISTTAPVQQSMNNEPIVLDTSVDDDDDNNLEVNSFVSKSIEEKPSDIEKIEEKSCLISVGSSSAKSDSDVKESSLSNEQQPTKQSTSQQQQNKQLITADEKPTTTEHGQDDDRKKQNQSSNASLSTTQKSATIQEQEKIKKDDVPSIRREPEKTHSQQPPRVSHPQTASFTKGFNRSTIHKINLSSDILKTLIPDVSLVPASVINDELDDLLNDNIESFTHAPILETNVNSADTMTIGDLADKKQHTNRTVVMDVLVDSSSINDDSIARKKATRMSSFESKTHLDGKMNTVITDEPVRVKHANAAHEPPSHILYIRGLTRPFSLYQLKELLSRYGTLANGEVWLDKIKSQCFAIFNTLEEAQHAREALDGCRWPLTNPKTLSVRFGRQDEYEFSKTHDLAPDQMSMEITSSHRSTTSPVNGMKSRPDVQESNLSKSQEEIRSGFLIVEDEEQPVTITEPPAKELEDYFRKTKAKPSIYWLPLTDEQVVERTQRAEQRRTERDIKQREQENVRATSDASQHKRKRSSSPSRRRR